MITQLKNVPINVIEQLTAVTHVNRCARKNAFVKNKFKLFYLVVIRLSLNVELILIHLLAMNNVKLISENVGMNKNIFVMKELNTKILAISNAIKL